MTQGKVCRLKKSLYGLKQELVCKVHWSISWLLFHPKWKWPFLCTIDRDYDFTGLLVYVDDVILTSTNQTLLNSANEFIHRKFRMKDLESPKNFLGDWSCKSESGIMMNQQKYIADLLSDTWILGCKPSKLPMETSHKLGLSKSNFLTDPLLYRRLGWISLCVTRPDISYSVHILCRLMESPRADHLAVAHKVLRYIKGAPAQGFFHSVESPLVLSAFYNEDWGACSRGPITWLLLIKCSAI